MLELQKNPDTVIEKTPNVFVFFQRQERQYTFKTEIYIKPQSKLLAYLKKKKINTIYGFSSKGCEMS